jgi:hypothetical protein
MVIGTRGEGMQVFSGTSTVKLSTEDDAHAVYRRWSRR